MNEDSSARALRLVAIRNFEDTEGNTYKNCVLYICNEHIKNNFQNVGISMGSEIEHVQSFVVHIVYIEKDRFKLLTVKPVKIGMWT